MDRMAWTDERMDDFVAHTYRRFDEVDKRFEQVDKRFEQVDKRFDSVERRMENGFKKVDDDIRELRGEMNARFDGLQRTMIQGVIALAGAFIAGFAALIVLIATQL
jgi:DNA anti-recombination protein RmuC